MIRINIEDKLYRKGEIALFYYSYAPPPITQHVERNLYKMITGDHQTEQGFTLPLNDRLKLLTALDGNKRTDRIIIRVKDQEGSTLTIHLLIIKDRFTSGARSSFPSEPGETLIAHSKRFSKWINKYKSPRELLLAGEI